MDNWLARIVALGLIVLSLSTVASATLLALNGKDYAPIVGLAGAAVGALAGFLTGVRLAAGTTEA